MITSIDQLGKSISLASYPTRIISLVPSQTELLYDLGLNEEVIGITKFCTYPAAWHHVKEKIGGTKNLNIKKISDLNPDLVIANKEENQRDQIESIEAFCPVWTSDVQTIPDAISMIGSLAALTDRSNRGSQIINAISTESNAHIITPTANRVVYLIWKDPWMTVGADTFINSMLEKYGLKNVFDGQNRYPVISEQNIRDRNPDIILLSSEPFPFKAKHQIDLRKKFPQTRVLLADGSMFSWYGSRLIFAGNYIRRLISEL